MYVKDIARQTSDIFRQCILRYSAVFVAQLFIKDGSVFLLFFSLELLVLAVHLVVYNFITGESVEYFEILWDWIVIECSLV